VTGVIFLSNEDICVHQNLPVTVEGERKIIRSFCLHYLFFCWIINVLSDYLYLAFVESQQFQRHFRLKINLTKEQITVIHPEPNTDK
jgi:hypothetical protein